MFGDEHAALRANANLQNGNHTSFGENFLSGNYVEDVRKKRQKKFVEKNLLERIV